MRTVINKMVLRHFLELTCRDCGRKETFTLANGVETDIPTHGLNSWTLGAGYGKDYKKTELCGGCAAARRQLVKGRWVIDLKRRKK